MSARHSIQKSGPFQALNQINLAIQEGDIFGIIGLSGAGKSTLVRCINYLEVPTEGEVRIAGRDLGKTESEGTAETEAGNRDDFSEF